jgi:hypothetical protein
VMDRADNQPRNGSVDRPLAAGSPMQSVSRRSHGGVGPFRVSNVPAVIAVVNMRLRGKEGK